MQDDEKPLAVYSFCRCVRRRMSRGGRLLGAPAAERDRRGEGGDAVPFEDARAVDGPGDPSVARTAVSNPAAGGRRASSREGGGAATTARRSPPWREPSTQATTPGRPGSAGSPGRAARRAPPPKRGAA